MTLAPDVRARKDSAHNAGAQESGPDAVDSFVLITLNGISEKLHSREKSLFAPKDVTKKERRSNARFASLLLSAAGAHAQS